MQGAARGHGPTPSPALLRAALAAGAVDLAGGADGSGGLVEPAPNPVQGWGRLDLGSLLAMGDHLLSVESDARLRRFGQVFELELSPALLGTAMKIVVAWTDVPACPCAEDSLENDLDVEVRQGEAL